MSSNMRALIDMKRRDQATEESRYIENRRDTSGERSRREQLAKITHSASLERAEKSYFDARRENYSTPKGFASTAYADGGPVQGIEPKGFVPVKVSNGEFEFTPEQVANIGAAMLASKEQVPA